MICEFFPSVQNLIIWHLLYSRENIPNHLFLEKICVILL
jgi:hypothetical protein